MMDVRRALTFLFEDPAWRRTLLIAILAGAPAAILGGVGLLGAGAPLDPRLANAASSPFWGVFTSLLSVPLFGYVLRIARNVIEGEDRPLPSWADPGSIVRDGLNVWVVIVLWGVPRTVFDLLRRDPAPSDGFALLLVTVFAGVFSAIDFAVSPAAQGRLAATGALVAGLDVPAAFVTFRKGWRNYLTYLLVSTCCFLVFFGVGISIVVLGQSLAGHQSSLRQGISAGLALTWLLIGPYVLFVDYHLIGQAYRASTIAMTTRTTGFGIESERDHDSDQMEIRSAHIEPTLPKRRQRRRRAR
ncbi:MAG: DUF4013 domain-containing protein [Thermomicrobiales bacterium]